MTTGRLGAVLGSLMDPKHRTAIIAEQPPVRVADVTLNPPGSTGGTPATSISNAVIVSPVFKLLVILVFVLIILSMLGAFGLSFLTSKDNPGATQAMNLMVNVSSGLVGAFIGLLGGKVA
jgi:hypothetical protein